MLYLNLQDVSQRRVFKTRWFSKVAKSHAIDDSELCKTVQAAMQGKADDLGGGVYKKRLNHNRDRAIILAKGGEHWYYTYLYAKQDKANIDRGELTAFRELARHYGMLVDKKILALMVNKELVEICHDDKK
ncbi:type II toxin-antitoxin system RelE/ParE family toxin [Erwinia sp. JUb26]|uniref:type II toxin-antitoxin system RelE/ParE family toxin n=1 Tax=Erwinia sp. JUb26 TaxID=2485126 RepID=UPI000F49E606|nr:type II toxin-antitoxin system RelE/ParE family toxin [Erwinia sp. JUb26]